jgi:hypothetical protein
MKNGWIMHGVTLLRSEQWPAKTNVGPSIGDHIWSDLAVDVRQNALRVVFPRLYDNVFLRFAKTFLSG